MQTIKAKRPGEEAAKKPALARAEILDKGARARFESEIDAAIKRRPPHEGKLAGALRALAPLSPGLRATMSDALSVLLKRGSLQRELYSGTLRALAEMEDKNVPNHLKKALTCEEAGGSAALCAACFSPDASLNAPLAKLAASRQSHLAFGAELARVARKESNGAHLTALAPMIKESHRISMCLELFYPLVRRAPVPASVGPALTVLRGAERHLGRWLILGEVAVKAGDETPVNEARSKADVGPSSARAAWSLVLWALEQTRARARSAPEIPPPQTRPTLELVARLSDRPSADRDTTFLFRMAQAKATVAKAMLEATAKQMPLGDEAAIRAALFLARDHAREDMMKALVEAATTSPREELRGLACAALWDVGHAGAREQAKTIAAELAASKVIGNVAWAALIRAAERKAERNSGDEELLVSENPFRWIQWGALE
jgi:hypothetical protein